MILANRSGCFGDSLPKGTVFAHKDGHGRLRTGASSTEGWKPSAVGLWGTWGRKPCSRWATRDFDRARWVLSPRDPPILGIRPARRQIFRPPTAGREVSLGPALRTRRETTFRIPERSSCFRCTEIGAVSVLLNNESLGSGRLAVFPEPLEWRGRSCTMSEVIGARP